MSLTGVPPVRFFAVVVVRKKKKKRKTKQQTTGKMPVRLMGKMPMLRSESVYYLLINLRVLLFARQISLAMR
jgi:hypothetical protein